MRASAKGESRDGVAAASKHATWARPETVISEALRTQLRESHIGRKLSLGSPGQSRWVLPGAHSRGAVVDGGDASARNLAAVPPTNAGLMSPAFDTNSQSTIGSRAVLPRSPKVEPEAGARVSPSGRSVSASATERSKKPQSGSRAASVCSKRGSAPPLPGTSRGAETAEETAHAAARGAATPAATMEYYARQLRATARQYGEPGSPLRDVVFRTHGEDVSARLHALNRLAELLPVCEVDFGKAFVRNHVLPVLAEELRCPPPLQPNEHTAHADAARWEFIVRGLDMAAEVGCGFAGAASVAVTLLQDLLLASAAAEAAAVDSGASAMDLKRVVVPSAAPQLVGTLTAVLLCSGRDAALACVEAACDGDCWASRRVLEAVANTPECRREVIGPVLRQQLAVQDVSARHDAVIGLGGLFDLGSSVEELLEVIERDIDTRAPNVGCAIHDGGSASRRDTCRLSVGRAAALAVHCCGLHGSQQLARLATSSTLASVRCAAITALSYPPPITGGRRLPYAHVEVSDVTDKGAATMAAPAISVSVGCAIDDDDSRNGSVCAPIWCTHHISLVISPPLFLSELRRAMANGFSLAPRYLGERGAAVDAEPVGELESPPPSPRQSVAQGSATGVEPTTPPASATIARGAYKALLKLMVDAVDEPSSAAAARALSGAGEGATSPGSYVDAPETAIVASAAAVASIAVETVAKTFRDGDSAVRVATCEAVASIGLPGLGSEPALDDRAGDPAPRLSGKGSSAHARTPPLYTFEGTSSLTALRAWQVGLRGSGGRHDVSPRKSRSPRLYKSGERTRDPDQRAAPAPTIPPTGPDGSPAPHPHSHSYLAERARVHGVALSPVSPGLSDAESNPGLDLDDLAHSSRVRPSHEEWSGQHDGRGAQSVAHAEQPEVTHVVAASEARARRGDPADAGAWHERLEQDTHPAASRDVIRPFKLSGSPVFHHRAPLVAPSAREEIARIVSSVREEMGGSGDGDAPRGTSHTPQVARATSRQVAEGVPLTSFAAEGSSSLTGSRQSSSRNPTTAAILLGLKQCCDDREDAVRVAALRCLGRLVPSSALAKHRWAVQALRRALRDTRAAVRYAAIESVANWAEAACQAVEVVAEVFIEGRVPRRLAAAALGAIGADGEIVLATVAQDKRHGDAVRVSALCGIGSYTSEHALEDPARSAVLCDAVTALLRDPSPLLRAGAVKTLHALGVRAEEQVPELRQRQVLPVLFRLLGDPSKGVRESAADALAATAPQGELLLLEGLQRVGSSRVRCAAAYGLARCGAQNSLALVLALRDAAAPVRNAAADALVWLGWSRVAACLEAMQPHSRSTMLSAARDAMSAPDLPEAVRRLLKFVASR